MSQHGLQLARNFPLFLESSELPEPLFVGAQHTCMWLLACDCSGQVIMRRVQIVLCAR